MSRRERAKYNAAKGSRNARAVDLTRIEKVIGIICIVERVDGFDLMFGD